MNMGIIFHSKSGTTRGFSKLIFESLTKNGHAVEIIELQTEKPADPGTIRRGEEIKILNLPDCGKFDILIIGGPVWAFTASPVIITFLNNLLGISGKKVLPFVTMGFPFAFMGGKQALRLMSIKAAELGADVLEGIIISKLFHHYHKNMEKAASDISLIFNK